MSLARYVAVVVGITGGSLTLLWPILGPRLDSRSWTAAVLGGGLAGVNTVLAYWLALWSQPRSTNVFLGAVLGGMVGRMGLMLAAVVAAVLGLGLPKVPLAVSLLSYFVIFLVFELSMLHQRTSVRAESR